LSGSRTVAKVAKIAKIAKTSERPGSLHHTEALGDIWGSLGSDLLDFQRR